MRLSRKLAEQTVADITDYYSVNLRAIWKDMKGAGAAFWWLCICLIFEYVRPQTLLPAIDILPWAQISLIMACVTAFTNKDIKWVANPGNTLLVLFLLIVVVSSMLAFHPEVSFSKIEIIINWVLIYFLMLTVINSEKKFIVFMLVFLLVNFKMSQFGARDFASRGFSYSNWGTSGAPGWFRDSGDLGIQMTIYIPLSIAFIMSFRQYWGRIKKLIFYLMPVTAVLTLVATSARGPQLGIVAAGIWFLLNKRNFKVLLIMLVLGGSIYMLLPEGMLQEYQVAGEDSTSRQRLALWSFGMGVIQEHPVLGVGYFNWIDYCIFKDPVGPDLGHCMVAHNAYITIAAETGFIGLGLFALITIFILRRNAQTRANGRKLGNNFILYIAYALDAGLIAYLIGTVFFTTAWYPIFWVQFAMTAVINEISSRQVKCMEASGVAIPERS